MQAGEPLKGSINLSLHCRLEILNFLFSVLTKLERSGPIGPQKF